MKNIITALLLLLLSLSASGQQYAIQQVTDSTVALLETTTVQDSLVSTIPMTFAIDSSSLETALFGFIRQFRTGQARAVRQEKEYSRKATVLNSLLNGFSDSLYFEWTQDNHAGQFLAAEQLPNYKIRIGSSFHWARCYIAGNGLLRMELTNASGQYLNPRDNATMYIQSTESFRLLPLDIIGEQVEFSLDRQDSRRKTWEGEKQDENISSYDIYYKRQING